MRELFITDAPAATILVRIMTGGVFLSEGIQKFLYPEELAAGRFAKIGIPSPEIMGPFVGGCEIVSGLLLIVGLLTRVAALVLLIDISVAIVSTKIPVLLGHGLWGFSPMKLPRYGFWSMMHEARTDFSMWLGLLFLMIVGAGRWSLDAALMKARGKSKWPTPSQ
jgi:uncharacterized membrane protein YphA (DoxX/SURF4 family)